MTRSSTLRGTGIGGTQRAPPLWRCQYRKSASPVRRADPAVEPCVTVRSITTGCTSPNNVSTPVGLDHAVMMSTQYGAGILRCWDPNCLLCFRITPPDSLPPPPPLLLPS